jgi:hypothetical protein
MPHRNRWKQQDVAFALMMALSVKVIVCPFDGIGTFRAFPLLVAS